MTKDNMKKVLALILAVMFSQQGHAMATFGVGKTCVFSKVVLQLSFNGEPVANAKVSRQWEWNKPNSDEATTDENGNVSFPAVFESSLSKFLPVELVVGQQLSVELDGEEKVFWTNSKREPEENAEYGGAPFHVQCELSEEEALIEDYGSLMVTMCKLVKG